MATMIFYPTGPGDATNIPSQSPSSGQHWDKVDEVTSDGETTYIYTSVTASYSYDLYKITPQIGSGTITSVALYYGVEARYAGETWFAKPCLKVAGDATVYYGTEYTDREGTWITFHYKTHTWNTNPSTSAAWTWSDIYTLQIGIALKAGSGTTPQCRCTILHCIVTYETETVKSNFGMGDCMVF